MKACVANSSDIDAAAAAEELNRKSSSQLAGARPRVGMLFAGIDFESPSLLDRLREPWPEMAKLICAFTSIRPSPLPLLDADPTYGPPAIRRLAN
jgi:hypothetical protein